MARAIDAVRFGEIMEQWKKDCLADNDTQGADIISDVILQLDDMPTLTPPNELMEALEAINNAAVAYIEGGPYENDLPGMELAVEIDRLSRDFVRPPEEGCEIKDYAETCEECRFCDTTLASPPEGEQDT